MKQKYTLKEAMLPDILYHGSYFKSEKELVPAFDISGEEVIWDETESNKFLYACTSREFAIDMGFASAFEKLYLVSRVRTTKDKLIINLDKTQKLKPRIDPNKIVIYLYEITNTNDFELVDNHFNGAVGEYKTNKHLTVGLDTEKPVEISWKTVGKSLVIIFDK